MATTPPAVLDLDAVADLLGIAQDSARTYHTRATRNRKAGTPKPGDLPAPDYIIGGRPGWMLQTLETWERPGQQKLSAAARRSYYRRRADELTQQIADLTALRNAVTAELDALPE